MIMMPKVDLNANNKIEMESLTLSRLPGEVEMASGFRPARDTLKSEENKNGKDHD